MSHDRFAGYQPVDLALNEIEIATGYVETIKDLLRQSGAFSADAIEALDVTVHRYETSPQKGLMIRDNGVYTPENHIYELKAAVDTVDRQTVYLARMLIVGAFGHVETLAEQFRMAVNPKWPLTGQPAIENGNSFCASIATRRTLDEFFMVGIEALKTRLAGIESARGALKSSTPNTGFDKRR